MAPQIHKAPQNKHAYHPCVEWVQLVPCRQKATAVARCCRRRRRRLLRVVAVVAVVVYFVVSFVG
eukprot:1855153-Amphidinium_carterae.1